MGKYEVIRFDEHLPIKLIEITDDYRQSEDVIEHWHHALEIVIPQTGAALFNSASIKKKVEVGELYIINSNVIHSFYKKENACVDYYHGYALQINDDYLKGIFKDYNDYFFRQPTGTLLEEMKETCMKIIECYKEENLIRYFHIQEYVNKLLYQIFDHLLIKKSNQDLLELNDDLRTINSVINFLEVYYQEDLSICELGPHFGMSRSHLSTLFKFYMGVGMKEYLDNIRILNAAEKILSTNHRITDIAYDSGFQSLRTFNTRFKDYFKMSPNAYRKTK